MVCLADATATPSSLAPLNYRLVQPFLCRLTEVVLEKEAVNGVSISLQLAEGRRFSWIRDILSVTEISHFKTIKCLHIYYKSHKKTMWNHS